jgi:integrase/recombinase XerC/integrase/recombinase XerD
MSVKQKRWQTVEKTSIPIATLVDRYLSACQSAGMSPKTIHGYNEKLQRYVRMVGGTLGDFTLEMVRQHLSNLQKSRKWDGHPRIPSTDDTLSKTTIRNHGRALASFSAWLHEEEYTDEHVLARLKIPKPDNISIEPLSEDEVIRLVSSFNISLEVGCRNAAMIWLFLDTGLRCAELVGLEMENLFLETKRLKIMGKGRKERILPFGHQAKRLLERYIHHLRPDPLHKDRVFLSSEGYPVTENTVKMVIQRARRNANIPRLHVHLLRHTFATRFVMRGGDTMLLQILMGHEHLETTQRYVKRGALQQFALERAFSPMDEIVLPRRLGYKPHAREKATRYVKNRKDGSATSAGVHSISKDW